MPLERARIIVEHTGEGFDVMFNPEEYTVNQDNNFASQNIPGLSGPVLQFVHGNMRTLEMELFFDTHAERRDVRDETQKVISLLDIDSDLHAPPILFVSWASLQFRCVLARAGTQFVKFMEDGRPVRARVSVTFNEYLDIERESRQVNRQTADFTKVHIAARGEMLHNLASRYYQDESMWRAIALENEIDDPQTDLTGVTLRIPPLPYRHPESGEVV